jgi:hypothetical protein
MLSIFSMHRCNFLTKSMCFSRWCCHHLGRKKLRQLLMVVLLIWAHNSVRRCTKLHHCALLHPNQSPWQWLYYHGDSSSFLLMMGLSRAAFCELSLTLFVDNNQQPILRRGKPELLDCAAQLGLYLFFIRSKMGIKHLCLIFGVFPSCCSDVINKMLWLVVKKLRNHPLAEVRFPNAEKVASFASLITIVILW